MARAQVWESTRLKGAVVVMFDSRDDARQLLQALHAADSVLPLCTLPQAERVRAGLRAVLDGWPAPP